LPTEFRDQVRFGGIGGPASGGTDHASFDCYGAPGFGLSSLSWDYNAYTHHTNRDTFDKVVFDEVKGNATITAMLVYLASEDPTFITRERRNLNEPDPTAGRGGRGGGAGGRGGRGGETVIGQVVRTGDSTTYVFTVPNPRPDTAGRAGGAGRGGRGAAGGGGRAADPNAVPTTDALGWPLTCNKGTRTSGIQQ
jgi:hypothetical protein